MLTLFACLVLWFWIRLCLLCDFIVLSCLFVVLFPIDFDVALRFVYLMLTCLIVSCILICFASVCGCFVLIAGAFCFGV